MSACLKCRNGTWVGPYGEPVRCKHCLGTGKR
jgi:hypothetical protein